MIYKRFKTVIILAVIGAFCMNGCQASVSREEMKVTETAYMKISAEDAKEIMDSTDDFVLIDVREDGENRLSQNHLEIFQHPVTDAVWVL